MLSHRRGRLEYASPDGNPAIRSPPGIDSGGFGVVFPGSNEGDPRVPWCCSILYPQPYEAVEWPRFDPGPGEPRELRSVTVLQRAWAMRSHRVDGDNLALLHGRINHVS